MLKIAIVGNIASGKSLMEKIVEQMGFIVFDTDLITHDILTDKPDVACAFKEYDVFEYGRLSKEKLGKLVFSDKKLKEKLESITHPLIKETLEQIFSTYSNEKILFISVPLLFEVGWEEMFDKIIFIKTDDNIRLERLIERNGYSKEYAKTRIENQLPQDEKCSKADYIIENNGTQEDFESKVKELLKSII